MVRIVPISRCALVWGIAWCALTATAFGRAEDPPRLELGQEIRATIGEDDPPIRTEILTRQYTDARVLGKTFSIRTPDEGACFLEARSYFFDAYLVVRAPDGGVAAEDDDGLVATDARIDGSALRPATDYTVEVGALDDGRGPFVIRFAKGSPPERPRAERDRETIRELLEAVRVVEEARGSEHPELAARLDHLSKALSEMGRYREALPYARRALEIAVSSGGEDDPRTARRRNNLAIALRGLGQFDEAEALLRRALASLEDNASADPMAIAAALNNLAELLSASGRYEVAAELYERALALRRSRLGPSNPLVALALHNLGMNALAQGDYEKSGEYLRAALTIVREALGENHFGTVSFRLSLATLAIEEGRYADAEREIVRAERIAGRTYGGAHPRTVSVRLSRAELLYERGRYADARALYETALEEYETSLGKNHPEVARLLNSLAVVISAQGRFEEASPMYARAIRIREEAHGPDHERTQRVRHNLAWHLAAQGLDVEAVALLESIVESRETCLGADHPATARSRNQLAAVLARVGRAADAKVELTRALAAAEAKLGPGHDDVAGMLNNLAELARDEGDLETAEARLRRALDIRARALGTDHPRTAILRANLGDLLADRGAIEKALPEVEGAARDLEETFGIAHPHTIAALRLLARVQADAGDLDQARMTATRALDAGREQADRVLGALTESERLRYAREARTLLELYLGLHRDAGNEELEGVYRRVLEWKGRVSRSLLRDERRWADRLDEEARDQLAHLRDMQQRISNELYRTASATDRPGEAARRLENLHVERSRLEREFVTVAFEEAGASLPPGGPSSSADPVSGLLDWLAEGEVSVDFLVHRAYEPASRAAEDDAERVPGRWSPPHVSAWVATRGGEEDASLTWVDLGEADGIRDAAKDYLDEMVASRGVRVGEGDPSRPSPASLRLHRRLWQPIEAIVGAAPRVVLSPDRSLGTVPFETIRGSDRAYLIERHAFVYLQSLADRPSRSKAAGASSEGGAPSLLLVGAVNYRKRSRNAARLSADAARDEAPSSAAPARGGFRETWRPLSATREEVDAVADIHDQVFGEGGRVLLTGDAATEDRVRVEMPRHACVHLATHGYFQPSGFPSAWARVRDDERGDRVEMLESVERITGLLPGLLSGLVFAGANDETPVGGANGLLTAEELHYADLSGCDLVVLSACETGLGEPAAGEGMIGLRRAIRQAGARTVISSLWSVLDDATRELMVRFYENLWIRKMSKLDALRAAQLETLRRNRADYGEALPSSWGAFVLDGAPD